MPDYNPAIAAQVQPPQAPAQPNFAQTLMQASEIQRNKASQALAEAQALQSQRKYNGLMAFSQSLAHNGDTNAAYQAGLAGGADPQDLKNGLDSFSQAKYMQGHNNMDPQTFSSNASGLSSLASAAKTQAGIPGEMAGSDQKIADLSAQHANQYIANPIQANWDDNVALTRKYKGQQAADQLAAIKDPDQRMALMKGHIGGGLTAEQATKLETTTGGQGVTSPLERLSAPVGNTQAPPQAGQAQAPQAGQQPGLLGGRPAPSVGAVKTQEGYAAQNVADLKEANEKYHNGAEVQSGLMQIQNNLDNVPQGGWYTTGTDAGKRVALAKGINTALEASGLGAPFDKGAIASAEAAQKGTVKLGFDLARSLGSREAQMIVQQSIGVQPGMEMTEQGNRRIMTGLMTAAQRDKDYTQFFQSYVKQNPDMTPGQAQVAFNQAHPPSEYVGNVNKILSLPKAAVDDLRKNPKLAPQFDAWFGGGDRLSRFVLGN